MMNSKISAFYSEYVIDGISKDLTPAQMLGSGSMGRYAPVIDESLDPVLISGAGRSFPMALAANRAKSELSTSIIDVLWKKGLFRIGNLKASALWIWNSEPVGNMAAFYSSVESFADYADALGVGIGQYEYKESFADSSIEVSVSLADVNEDIPDSPFSVDDPELFDQRMQPDKCIADDRSWVVYVPFQMEWAQDNPDYFIDCFEIIRELVEDGIILSGRTVSRGGLQKALEGYMQDCGLVARISEIKKYFEMEENGRILEDEVPGVLFQIRDIDYDYIDAEFLLQDVAYFPLGNPSGDKLAFDLTDKTGLQTILEAIINSQSSEGED